MTNDFIKELKNRNPIEEVIGSYISLRRSGNKYVACCPFHNEKTPSFTVFPDSGSYYCFGCGAGGDVITFIMKTENLDYQDAVQLLAVKTGLAIPEDKQNRNEEKERLQALCKDAAQYYRTMLYTTIGAAALNYAQKRGLSKDILNKFGIGFAPDSRSDLIDAMREKGYTDQELKDTGLAAEKDERLYDRFRGRLMFPIMDTHGNVIGFSGLSVDNSSPKYLNSPETQIFNNRDHLFALNFARKSNADALILVEGYLEVMTLHQHGFDNVVASLGTSLTEEQAKLLSKHKKRVFLIYDEDEAGQMSASHAIPMLEKAGLEARILRINDAKDPAEFLRKFGAEQFERLLNK